MDYPKKEESISIQRVKAEEFNKSETADENSKYVGRNDTWVTFIIAKTNLIDKNMATRMCGQFPVNISSDTNCLIFCISGKKALLLTVN